MNKKNIEGFLQTRENPNSEKSTKRKEQETEGRLLSRYSFVTIWKRTFLCLYLKKKNKYHPSLS